MAEKKSKNLYDKIRERHGLPPIAGIDAADTGTQSSQDIFVLVEDSSDESDEEEIQPIISVVPPWRKTSKSSQSAGDDKGSTLSKPQTAHRNMSSCCSQAKDLLINGNDPHRKLASPTTADNLSIVVEQDSCSISESIYTSVNHNTTEPFSGAAAKSTRCYGQHHSQSVVSISDDKENIHPSEHLYESRPPAEISVGGTQHTSNIANRSTQNVTLSRQSLTMHHPPSCDGREKTTRNIAVQTMSMEKKKSAEKREATANNPQCDLPSQVTVNNKTYTVLNLLGKGGSSKVEQVFDFDSSRRLALKTVNLIGQPTQNVMAFRKEIEMLRRLEFSDRVISLIDFEERTESLYLLLECGDTDLAVYLKKKLEEKRLHRMQRCMFWHEMLEAVQVLHNQGIVHSDIKPANFILVAGQLKLIDFGIARQLDADATSMVLDSCVGTLNYMSPEVLQGLGSKHVDSKAGRKADVWSLGCILYYMTYGVTPFQSINPLLAKVSAITSDLHTIDIGDVGEPHLSHTIQVCLLRDYRKRASIEELLDHPYVK